MGGGTGGAVKLDTFIVESVVVEVLLDDAAAAEIVGQLPQVSAQASLARVPSALFSEHQEPELRAT